MPLKHYQYDPGDNEKDGKLWKEIKSGNKTALVEAYNLYARDVARYGWQLVKNKAFVEDVMHDLFVSIWDRRDNLPDVHRIKLYLMTALRRTLIRKVKKEKIFNNHLLNDYSGAATIIPSFLDEMLTKDSEEETVERIRRALNLLSERQKEIIYLKFYQNMSYKEISDLLNLDQKYVYNLANRAFASFREKYGHTCMLYLTAMLAIKPAGLF